LFDYTSGNGSVNLASLYVAMKTYVWNNSLVDKYSEWPVNFIIKLFVNGVHVESLIADEMKLNFEKLNKK